MKKYLMTGIAALGMGSLFTSCGPDMSVYNVSQSEQVLQKYEQSFVQSKFYRNTSSHSYRLLVSQPPLRHGVSVLQLLLAQEVRRVL